MTTGQWIAVVLVAVVAVCGTLDRQDSWGNFRSGQVSVAWVLGCLATALAVGVGFYLLFVGPAWAHKTPWEPLSHGEGFGQNQGRIVRVIVQDDQGRIRVKPRARITVRWSGHKAKVRALRDHASVDNVGRGPIRARIVFRR